MQITKSLTAGLIAGAVVTILMFVVSLIAPDVVVPPLVENALVLLATFGVSSFVKDTPVEVVQAHTALAPGELATAKREIKQDAAP